MDRALAKELGVQYQFVTNFSATVIAAIVHPTKNRVLKAYHQIGFCHPRRLALFTGTQHVAFTLKPGFDGLFIHASIIQKPQGLSQSPGVRKH